MENFKLIPGYQPYEVSDLGRLRRNGKILSTPIAKCGYKRKYLKDIRKNLWIHRAIAICFVPNPHLHPVVNHLDGNKLNNAINNLEWCTYSRNMQHAVDSHLKSIVQGSQCGRSKLTETDVSIVLDSLKAGYTQSSIASYFGVNQSTISLIKNGKNWKHVCH